MYSGDLYTILVRYLNSQKEVGCQMVRYQMLFEYRTAQPFEYQTSRHHLVVLCTGVVFK